MNIDRETQHPSPPPSPFKGEGVRVRDGFFSASPRLRFCCRESIVKHVMYVQIMGHEYPVEANSGDDLYVNRLAQFVEERMKEIKEESNVVDSYKLAIMAAMNISDELFHLKDTKGSHSHSVETKADELIHLLDTVLHPAG